MKQKTLFSYCYFTHCLGYLVDISNRFKTGVSSILFPAQGQEGTVMCIPTNKEKKVHTKAMKVIKAIHLTTSPFNAKEPTAMKDVLHRYHT